jgi:hypothetical protein
MTLTGTLAAGESIVIDCDAYTITLEPDGTDLLQAGWLGASETFFELRPPSSYTLGCPQAALAVTFYRAWET